MDMNVNLWLYAVLKCLRIPKFGCMVLFYMGKENTPNVRGFSGNWPNFEKSKPNEKEPEERNFTRNILQRSPCSTDQPWDGEYHILFVSICLSTKFT